MHSQVQFGKLVNIFVDGFSHLWHSDQLTWKKYNSFRVEQKIDQQQVVEQKTHQSHCGWDHTDVQRGSFSSQSFWSLPLAAFWTDAVETLTATWKTYQIGDLLLAKSAWKKYKRRLTFSCQSFCKDSWSCQTAEPSLCSAQSQKWLSSTDRHSVGKKKKKTNNYNFFLFISPLDQKIDINIGYGTNFFFLMLIIYASFKHLNTPVWHTPCLPWAQTLPAWAERCRPAAARLSGMEYEYINIVAF